MLKKTKMNKGKYPSIKILMLQNRIIHSLFRSGFGAGQENG